MLVSAVCGNAHAQIPPQTAAAALAAEFPPYDFQLLGVVQRGMQDEAASRALAGEPDSVETLSALIALNRIDEAIVVARRILEKYPDRAVPVVTAIAFNGHRFSNAAKGHPEAVQEIAARARALVSKLPREEAARLARQLLMIERRPAAPGVDTYREAADDVLRQYAGTQEALLLQVDLLERGRVSWAQLQALDDFARAHPRSIPAARALFSKGWQLSVNVPVTGLEPRGSDPTDRFFRVLAVVKELEGGDYPKCEWVDRAPQLITGFFASNPKFAPGNVDRLAAEYVAFARTHLASGSLDSAGDGMGYLLTTKLAELYNAESDPLAVVERTLDAMVNETGRPEVSYLKFSFYLYTAVNDPPRRTAMREKARSTLSALSQAGTDLYHRKALAALACLEFEDHDHRAALQHFSQYVQRYRQSPYAWVAALRIGASQEALRDWRAAATAYQVATEYSSNPVAQVMGHEFAARSLEGIDRLEEALQERERALRAWNPNYGTEYTLYSRWADLAPAVGVFEPVSMITQDDLSQRIGRSRAWLSHPSGRLVARGQWLLEHEQRADAVETLRRMQQFPGSPLASQARLLLHHAQLELALTQANVESASADPNGALRQLTELVREPYDEAICVAGVARATLLMAAKRDEADATMRDTLTQCRTNGSAKARSTSASSLEADVLAVRDAVFQPSGGGVYGTRGWNAFTWPSVKPPFLIVNPALTVKTSDGVVTEMVRREAFPAADNVVFFTAGQIHLLNGVMTALGGTKIFVPASIMATPNQPAGPAVDIRAYWNQFFPCRPGHWGGWEFEAYPRIASIEFLDAARTKAAVPVTIGYAGATVVLEKQNGVWRALRLTNEWIT